MFPSKNIITKYALLYGLLLGSCTSYAQLNPALQFLHRKLRDARAGTMHQALSLMEERNVKTIVETGTARGGHMAFSGDGGFTIITGYWCSLNQATLYSVDISEKSIDNAKTMVQDYLDSIEFVEDDSVHFLQNFDRKIDFLYLDSLDFDKNNPIPSQEHHLEEIKVAYDKLHPRSIVMIDDCALPHGGKGKLVIEYLLKRGWQLIANNYQVILTYPHATLS